jgi:uncharacterized membrane protein YozB (DUF420 family)
MLHWMSAGVLLLVLGGLWLRKRRPEMHFRVMLGAFAIDLLLTVYIELTRAAVEKVALHGRPILWIHAAISLAVLGSYVAMFFLGRPMLQGRYDTRMMHKYLGISFVVLRSLNYATSFFVV